MFFQMELQPGFFVAGDAVHKTERPQFFEISHVGAARKLKSESVSTVFKDASSVIDRVCIFEGKNPLSVYYTETRVANKGRRNVLPLNDIA